MSDLPAAWIVNNRPIDITMLKTPGIVSLDRLTRLVAASFRFGVVGGCRVTDDTVGIDFRWRLAP